MYQNTSQNPINTNHFFYFFISSLSKINSHLEAIPLWHEEIERELSLQPLNRRRTAYDLIMLRKIWSGAIDYVLSAR